MKPWAQRLVLLLAVLAGAATIGLASAPHAHASGGLDVETCAFCVSSADFGALDLPATALGSEASHFEPVAASPRRIPAARVPGNRPARAPPLHPCTH